MDPIVDFLSDLERMSFRGQATLAVLWAFTLFMHIGAAFAFWRAWRTIFDLIDAERDHRRRRRLARRVYADPRSTEQGAGQ